MTNKKSTEKRTETHACDLISRQQAIDALDCISGVEEVLRSLPSAQPEPSIPISWIEKHCNYLRAYKNALSNTGAICIELMLEDWQEGKKYDS